MCYPKQEATATTERIVITAKVTLPPPSVTLTKADARRFMLAHQRLLTPRQLMGKQGVLDFVKHVGCIQYDPINVVGRSADITLQARVGDYSPAYLEQLLYQDRKLVDGWDKVASIYAMEDRPYFERHRKAMQDRHIKSPAREILPHVLKTIEERGPQRAQDFQHAALVMGGWGKPIRMAREALNVLYDVGDLALHNRVGAIRVFDLAEKLVPEDILHAEEPNLKDVDYQDWHVMRRIGSMGIVQAFAGDHWNGITNVKSIARKATIRRLVEAEQLTTVEIEDLPQRQFYVRTADLPRLHLLRLKEPVPNACLIGPLDNLIWDRDLIRAIFDFDYVWEVYKPAVKRQYGYYVLPVIYQDRFIARVDLGFDKKTRMLSIENWWWEANVTPDDAMRGALIEAFQAFMRYLDTRQLQLGESYVGEILLDNIVSKARMS